jgi:hypothetical protein
MWKIFSLLIIIFSENSFGGVFGNIKVTGIVTFEDDRQLKLKTSKESILIPKSCVSVVDNKKNEIMINSSCVLDFFKL